MTQKSFKAYKNMPVRCCFRKPRYWYVDKVVFPKDGAIYDNVLEPFEGINKEIKRSFPVIKIPEMKLWNNTYTEEGTYTFRAPYEAIENVVTGRNFTKVGSPSINISNIASGFSKNNYLSIDTSTNKPEKFEAVVCLTTPSSFNSSVKSAMIIQSAKDSSFSLYFRTPYWTDGTANKLQLNVGGDGNGFPEFILTDEPLLMDTQYWIKVIWDGKVWSLSTSTNGEDYKLEGEIEYDYGTYSSTFTLGNGANWNYDNAFNGTINLFSTYIKQTITEEAESEYYVPVENEDSTYSLETCKGIGNVTSFQHSGLLYSLYKDDETNKNITEVGNDDINGKTWFGNIIIPMNFKFTSFKRRWSIQDGSTSVPEYYTDGKENLWVKLGNNARLIPYQPRYYTEVPTTSFFDYDIRITLEVITPSSFNCNKILARVGTPSSWFGCYSSSGKLSVSSRIESSSGLSTNTHYWVRLGDKYSSSTGKWTHRVCYIKDNGYTRETLPDESKWTTKTLTETTSWFNSMSSFGTLGDVRSDKNCWDGAINLSNCYVEFGAGGVGDGMTYQYLCNFADGDYVEPEPPQIELA